MRRPTPGALLAVLALAGTAACGGLTGAGEAQEPADAAGTLTVWLQTDARTLWPKSVEAATAEFHRAYPKVQVSVAYQAWTDHLSKFDAAAQARRVPDVIELGTSETAQYNAAGAFLDLAPRTAEFDNSADWQKGLADACHLDGKLYCVPYYGGTRAVVYRKDLLADAGVTRPPATWAELRSAVAALAERHRDDQGFSPFYLPGQHPYGALPFVLDAGGAIASRGPDGRWRSELSSPAAITGLKNWKSLVDAGMRGDRTANDLGAAPALAAGTAAMSFSTNGQLVKVFGPEGDPALKDRIGSFPMPSPARTGQVVPPYLGGSVLAVPAMSRHRQWATEWTRRFTATAREKEFLAGGFLANTTTLTSDDPQRAGYFQGLEHSWSVPAAENWAAVEKANLVKQMLVAIATGRATPEDATRAYGKKIEALLNTPT
ncbi:extracellular solute-binding protein [Kitasatospora sp. NPDC088346]|uniref:extracellular solute-binding protein n=1 Tax=Kitasatospora sp. NPDC088346 TaxID=3364073 RepID=UPI0037F70C46